MITTMKRGTSTKSTKWLKGLLDKACMSDKHFDTYYGHDIFMSVGTYGIINITIDNHMEISVDEDLSKVTCSNVPKDYIKPIMDYLNEIYFGFNYQFSNHFTELVLPYSETSEEWKNGNRGYVTINWFDEEDREDGLKNYEERFIRKNNVYTWE